MQKDVFNVAELTKGQPFCAGVILVQDGTMLVTLNPDGLPAELEGKALRVGGVGGGQEPGETIFECALREGAEELSTPVSLIGSDVTYFHDLDTGDVYEIQCEDEVAPFLFERMTNPNPEKPFRPGLPTGPYLYFGLFLSKPEHWDFQPGDDVQGLMQIPPSLWSEMSNSSPSIAELLQKGARVKLRDNVSHDLKVYVPTKESFATVAALLVDHETQTLA